VDWRKLGYDSWVVNRRKLMIVDDAGYCVGQGEVVIETEDPGRGVQSCCLSKSRPLFTDFENGTFIGFDLEEMGTGKRS